MNVKQFEGDPPGQEKEVRFGARQLDKEKPGSEWKPAKGEVFVQSLYFESGEAEEYGESQAIHGEARIKSVARLIQELHPEPGDGSIVPLEDSGQRQIFYQRMRAIALQALKDRMAEVETSQGEIRQSSGKSD